MPTRAALPWSLSLALLLLLPSTAAGQVVRGRVLDAATGQPLPLVTITLLDARDSALTRAWSDDSGHFTLRVRRTGSYAVQARRIGYEPLRTVALPLDSRESPQLELTMIAAAAQALDTVVVTAPRSWKDVRSGRSFFYEHQERGRGVFLTREDLALLKPDELADALTHVPGLVLFGPRRLVRSTRGSGCMARTINRFESSSWRPAVQRSPNEFRGMSFEHPEPTINRIVGVEVYREFSEVPPAYRYLASSGSRFCGLIVVWTVGAW